MGIEELWETVFFSTFFPGCFQPHELLLLQTGALAFPILLSDCSCHRLLPVDPTWQTPWEDKFRDLQHTSEDQGDHHPLFSPQGGGSTSYIEQSGAVWLCWKWGIGAEGLVLTPLQKKAGHFNLFLQKLSETLMPTSSACLTSVTPEVALLFIHLPF